MVILQQCVLFARVMHKYHTPLKRYKIGHTPQNCNTFESGNKARTNSRTKGENVRDPPKTPPESRNTFSGTSTRKKPNAKTFTSIHGLFSYAEHYANTLARTHAHAYTRAYPRTCAHTPGRGRTRLRVGVRTHTRDTRGRVFFFLGK